MSRRSHAAVALGSLVSERDWQRQLIELGELLGVRLVLPALDRGSRGAARLGDRLQPSLDHEEDRYWRATIVPAGSYEADKARQERVAIARDPRPLLTVRPSGWPMSRELLPWLRQRGVELAVVDGRLLVTSLKGSVLDMIRGAIADHAALLVGWLTDAPVTCWRHKCEAEAATVLLGGVPACAEHAR